MYYNKHKILAQYQSEQIEKLQRRIKILTDATHFNKQVCNELAELFKFTYSTIKGKISDEDYNEIHTHWVHMYNNFLYYENEYNKNFK